MFTSRAEYRLLLGIDSAPYRLAVTGARIGLVPRRTARAIRQEKRDISIVINILGKFRQKREGGSLSLLARLRQPGTQVDEVLAELSRSAPADAPPPVLSGRGRRHLAGRVKYAGYIRRQLAEARRLARDDRRSIPIGFEYEAVGGLSREVVEKLTQVQPESLGQAGRISGVTPAALAAVRIALKGGKERSRGLAGNSRALPDGSGAAP
jgi:tRNA uridine 5-carboxymethylaminomethyl modification enzyme